MHTASQGEKKGMPPPKDAHCPAQSPELLPLLPPVVVPKQATLGTAGMDKQGLPDLPSLPLQHQSEKYAVLQGQPVSSSSKLNVAPAGEGFCEDPTDGDPPPQFALVGQQAAKSRYGLFRVHSNVPNSAARTWTITHNGNTPRFFSHAEETAAEVK